ncbi:S-(hydroxymethyl)glutathione synthase [Patescibacteria group bacterium]|nr:S-(hydroxymethyl)glutathione synthase [Patescibacteria group bacterium]
MLTLRSGGCLCGAVRYECSAEPVFSANCHCRDCQKLSGGAYIATFFVTENSVTITGEVQYFDKLGDSGHWVKRGFCPNCGSQVFGKPEVVTAMLGIRAGSLDNPALYQPQMDIYAASAQPWDFMNPDLPKFSQLPPRI